VNAGEDLECRHLQRSEDESGAAVNTLDELSRDPERIGELTHEEASDRLLRVTALALALSNQVVATSGIAQEAVRSRIAAADRLIDVKAAAKIIGMSATALYRHKDRYPFFVRNGFQIRFSTAGIAKWIEKRAGRTARAGLPSI